MWQDYISCIFDNRPPPLLEMMQQLYRIFINLFLMSTKSQKNIFFQSLILFLLFGSLMNFWIYNVSNDIELQK